MAIKVVQGNTVVLTWTAKKLTDPFAGIYAAYDPLIPTLTLEDPLGNETVFTYPDDAIIERPDTQAGQPFDPTNSGLYFAAVKTDETTAAGPWKYQWKDPDDLTPGLVEGSYTVAPPKIL